MLFSTIPGQEKVKEKLIRTVVDQRNSHAQLFFGLDGGAQMALALAYIQYLMCEDPSDEDSCGHCPSCLQNMKLIHPDVHFSYPFAKTAKSSDKPTSTEYLEDWRSLLLENPYATRMNWLQKLGIENKQAIINVRESDEISRKLQLKSYSGGYKVMIIWLPESLHMSAANKLLKLIEEPQPKTLILLVSNQREAILQTILSRTQGISVPPYNKEAIRGYLEKLHPHHRALDFAVLKAEGSMGHGLEFLKQQPLFAEYSDWFVRLNRAAFKPDVQELLVLAETVGQQVREKQKDFLQFALSLYEATFLMNQEVEQPRLVPLEEAGFKTAGFSKFIEPQVAIKIQSSFERAIFEIGRNAAGKIVLLDTFLQLSKDLRKKP
ncbi:MAG: hypothetical protein LPK25_09355 [Cyclobacteriaceae bacterium]|nr:hypothetical protein [Cyclobacteriaceae bacterium]MDX5427954.1 DNA polymerase III subunit delta [Bacteroidota bacterium]MDX5449229.1 DNA polymerase III subunit delta [Bacteroidota bacterium]MDX5505802.1 DNA polymerase III subunit delta [Bacteroidota bacterium]